jgi:hypothetical protein
MNGWNQGFPGLDQYLHLLKPITNLIKTYPNEIQ